MAYTKTVLSLVFLVLEMRQPCAKPSKCQQPLPFTEHWGMNSNVDTVIFLPNYSACRGLGWILGRIMGGQRRDPPLLGGTKREETPPKHPLPRRLALQFYLPFPRQAFHSWLQQIVIYSVKLSRGITIYLSLVLAELLSFRNTRHHWVCKCTVTVPQIRGQEMVWIQQIMTVSWSGLQSLMISLLIKSDFNLKSHNLKPGTAGIQWSVIKS